MRVQKSKGDQTTGISMLHAEMQISQANWLLIFCVEAFQMQKRHSLRLLILTFLTNSYYFVNSFDKGCFYIQKASTK